MSNLRPFSDKLSEEIINKQVKELDALGAQLAAVTKERDARKFECTGRNQSLPEPGECNWPHCGCDPYANKVLEETDYDALRTERDDAKHWEKQHRKSIDDARAALGDWLLIQPDGGDVTLAEGIERLNKYFEIVTARAVAMKNILKTIATSITDFLEAVK